MTTAPDQECQDSKGTAEEGQRREGERSPGSAWMQSSERIASASYREWGRVWREPDIVGATQGRVGAEPAAGLITGVLQGKQIPLLHLGLGGQPSLSFPSLSSPSPSLSFIAPSLPSLPSLLPAFLN